MSEEESARQRILVVDDSPEVIHLLLETLSEDYIVTVSITGERALRLAISEPQPDIILLDLMLPDMDGFEVCRQLRANHCTDSIPIIFITGGRDIDDELKGLELGAVDFIHKPFNPMLLKVRLRSHMMRGQQLKLKMMNMQLEKQVQEEVRKNREKDAFLLQQDKMASIGQLAAGVAHEINNPMGFIMSNMGTLKGYASSFVQYFQFTDVLVEQFCSAELKQQANELKDKLDIEYISGDILNLIRESMEGAERVRQIVMDLKDFARIDESSHKETDINQCIRSTINIVKNELKYVASLDLSLGELPLVYCNPQQINQVITNLLVNAAQAITGHGVIRVSTLATGNKVLIEIADTGKGIPKEIIKQVFEPFFTTKPVGKGTGLGLTITYDIIKKHAGEISVESEPGKGTVFRVTLPVSASEEKQ